MQITMKALLLGPLLGKRIIMRITITAMITSNSISVSPVIFALAESVFMAAETVTPNAPATSAKIA